MIRCLALGKQPMREKAYDVSLTITSRLEGVVSRKKQIVPVLTVFSK
jgi:inorganic pyrophosphatase/exopolyphosphatase